MKNIKYEQEFIAMYGVDQRCFWEVWISNLGIQYISFFVCDMNVIFSYCLFWCQLAESRFLRQYKNAFLFFLFRSNDTNVIQDFIDQFYDDIQIPINLIKYCWISCWKCVIFNDHSRILGEKVWQTSLQIFIAQNFVENFTACQNNLVCL